MERIGQTAVLAELLAGVIIGPGVWAEGSIDTAGAVGPALRRARHVVKHEGRPALLDVITRP